MLVVDEQQEVSPAFTDTEGEPDAHGLRSEKVRSLRGRLLHRAVACAQHELENVGKKETLEETTHI